jgi:hypothetical protein
MGFGSYTFRCCRVLCTPGGVASRFAARLQLRVGVPLARERWGRQRFSALSGSERADAASDPKVGRLLVPSRFAARRLLRFRSPSITPEGATEIGRMGSGATPKGGPRPRLFRSPKGPASAPMNQPEGRFTVPVRCTRRCPVSGHRVAPKSLATQCSTAPRRAGTGGSSSYELSFRGTRKHPVHDSRRSPLHSRTRRCGRGRATLARRYPARSTAASNLVARPPKGIASPRRAARPPEGGPFWRAPWLRSLPSKLGCAGLRPDRHRLHRSGRDREVPSLTRRSTSRRARRRGRGC